MDKEQTGLKEREGKGLMENQKNIEHWNKEYRIMKELG
jgi:hypothetical protein